VASITIMARLQMELMSLTRRTVNPWKVWIQGRVDGRWTGTMVMVIRRMVLGDEEKQCLYRISQHLQM
jgi:hypothetical protein